VPAKCASAERQAQSPRVRARVPRANSQRATAVKRVRPLDSPSSPSPSVIPWAALPIRLAPSNNNRGARPTAPPFNPRSIAYVSVAPSSGVQRRQRPPTFRVAFKDTCQCSCLTASSDVRVEPSPPFKPWLKGARRRPLFPPHFIPRLRPRLLFTTQDPSRLHPAAKAARVEGRLPCTLKGTHDLLHMVLTSLPR
jgi:hypothetical protein